MNAIPADRAAMPHCDARILHAPGECEACDLFPDWQELREWWGIAFTGHAPVHEGHRRQLPCPADHNRPSGTPSDHQRWPGNRPWQQGEAPPLPLPDPRWPTRQAQAGGVWRRFRRRASDH